jgi:hypothetical protein
MNRRSLFILGIAVFAFLTVCLLILASGVWRPLLRAGNREQRRTRIIIPHEASNKGDSDAERMAYEESINTWIALEDGEIVISVLTQDFDNDASEEQIVAYRNLLETDNPVYLTYVDYDPRKKEYRRLWSVSAAAARLGTISLYTQDLVGDRNNCVIVTGMNSQGEYTMSVFQRKPQSPAIQPFAKLAELRIDGSIVVQEVERSQAYHQGISKGQSYTIAAYGHDTASVNILDQIETVYAFNPAKGVYEQNKVIRIPGSQIEQRRLRELLSGEKGVFERFINDLWYYVSPQGTVDHRQYIFFDPAGKEIIFFGDEAQQVFIWQQSSPTRYGLYVSSQNISITTLRRFLDIELESLDSIRLRVFEDVRLKIAVGGSWDGSYRRAASHQVKQPEKPVKPYVDAVYDSSWGRLRFYPDGIYEISSGGIARTGYYVFFRAGGQDLLELRPENAGKSAGADRMVYRIDPANAGLSLSRVRLGAAGIQDLHEGQVVLSAVSAVEG